MKVPLLSGTSLVVVDVPENGVVLHKEDLIFTSPSGDDYAVLTQAPDAEYDQYASLFSKVVASTAPY